MKSVAIFLDYSILKMEDRLWLFISRYDIKPQKTCVFALSVCEKCFISLNVCGTPFKPCTVPGDITGLCSKFGFPWAFPVDSWSRGSKVGLSSHNCCHGNTTIPFLCVIVEINVTVNNKKVSSDAKEMQQLVSVVLLTSCKIFRTAVKYFVLL
jgi:hypothetical protein